jgi:hypothetical protein
MKKLLSIGIIFVILILSVIGCSNTTTITATRTETSTLPVSTTTVKTTTTANLTTTVNNTITSTVNNTITSKTTSTITQTNISTVASTVSVTTTAVSTTTTVSTVVNTITVTITPSTTSSTTTTNAVVGVPLGTTANAILIAITQIPGGYYQIEEPHNISMTVMEIVRGSKAWDIIKAADASNKAPDTGNEYLIARVKFTYGSGGNVYYTLKKEYFKAYSSANKEYATPSVVDPKPVLVDGTALYQGQMAEGWIAFTVAQSDTKPVMFFFPSSTWFQLY